LGWKFVFSVLKYYQIYQIWVFVRKYTVTLFFTLLFENFDYEIGQKTFFILNTTFFQMIQKHSFVKQ